MGLIAICTIVILTGLIILIIGLNEMVTVAIIIIKAVGVDQTHGAVDGLQPWIRGRKTCRKRQEGRGEGGSLHHGKAPGSLGQ